MTTIDLPLTEVLEQFIAHRVAAGGYSNGKEFILALLEQARRVEERAALDSKLIDGVAALDRGEGRPMTADDWARLRANVGARQGTGDRS